MSESGSERGMSNVSESGMLDLERLPTRVGIGHRLGMHETAGLTPVMATTTVCAADRMRETLPVRSTITIRIHHLHDMRVGVHQWLTTENAIVIDT